RCYRSRDWGRRVSRIGDEIVAFESTDPHCLLAHVERTGKVLNEFARPAASLTTGAGPGRWRSRAVAGPSRRRGGTRRTACPPTRRLHGASGDRTSRG